MDGDEGGAPQSAPRLTGNKRELAAFLRVSLPTVEQLVDAGCPVLEGGTNGKPYVFDFAAVVEWRQARDELRERQAADRKRQIDAEQARLFGDDDLPEDAELAGVSPRARAEIVKFRREYLLLLERQRNLVKFDDVVLGLAETFSTLKGSIRSLADVLQRQLGLNEEAATRLVELIDDRLNDAVDAAQKRLAEVGGNAKAA